MRNLSRWTFELCLLVVSLVSVSSSQVSVTTYHYDNARTGQNIQETSLAPANVNSNQFGKLYTTLLDGYVYAQPLYLPNVQNIAGGTHNVLYVATEHDSLFALDADSGAILWQKSFINPGAGITTVSSGDVNCGDLVPEVGITSTPVIDPASGTIYLVAKTKENGQFFQRLHAINTVSGAEKFGGPVVISATVSGSGDGGTTVTFNPLMEHNRPGLLLSNGHVVIAWASHCDNTPYHGWVMSYAASTLLQEAVFNTSPNGGLSGIWMSGDGVAADANGNYFFAVGNGTYDGTSLNDYGDSIVKLGPPSGNTLPVLDWFTPWNQGSLSNGDTDVGSGGLVLLPDLPSGSAHQQLLAQMGKEGKIYLVDRNNMGKYCSSCINTDTNIVQEIAGASTGIWGSPAYWNNSVYWSSGNDGGSGDNLLAFSFNANSSGMLSTTPTSESNNVFSYSTAAPVVSANGSLNGIVWLLDNHTYGSGCCQILYAYDATNLASMLYNSSQAANNRDVPGNAVKFTAPVVANGKVFVGSQGQVSAFGTISSTPTAATPTFSPAPGSYINSVTVSVADTTPGAALHCTTDGSTPTSSSPTCTTYTFTSTTTLRAIAVATGYNNSAVATGTYAIGTGSGINYGGGFSASGMTLNGSATINGTRLRLTDGNTDEAASAFYTTPINIQTFTNNFAFQLSSPNADGMTFTIQNAGVNALGPLGGGLAYGPDLPGGTPGIGSSVAVKFDLYNNDGEGINSTGMYTDGASPTVPSIDLTSSGVNLHSGDIFNVQMTYDGANLTMTITDSVIPTQTFTTSWPINIPATVGSNTAFLGFTAGTGGNTATQDILTWTYTSSGAQKPSTTALASSLNPAYVTQTVVYTATVMGQSGTPTGTVTFYQGATPLSTVTLSNGKGSYSTSYSSSGTYSITATYSGDANNAASTSTAVQEVINNLPAATTTSLSASSSSINIGQPVTFTATVTSTFGTPPNGELVTFKNGTQTLGTGSLTNGVATFTTTALPLGADAITASYAGDANFAASTSAVITVTVSKYTTTTALTDSPNPSNYGQKITFTATVTANGYVPTGSVSFKDSGVTIGASKLSNGVATLTKATLALGSHSITAVYGGNPDASVSTSPVVNQAVNQATTTTALKSSLNPSKSGQSVTFTATVTSNGGVPSGSVTFTSNGTPLATVNTTNGRARYTTNSLVVGSDVIVGTFNATADYGASSASLTQVVN